MKAADGIVMFKEWLPDAPDLDNPGLTEAKNVIPVNGNYEPFYALLDGGGTMPAQPRGAFRSYSTAGSAVYAGTETLLYKQEFPSWTAKSATFGSATYWRFAQYNDLVIAVSDAGVPQAVTNGSASNFANLATTGSAPVAQQIARVGQFVVLGDRNAAEPHSVQWPAINNPRNWPTPGSSTAIASQAGEQLLNSGFGTVNGIAGGDQYGIILQSAGITRMTYVGGSVVFQFDEISDGIGCHFPNSIVQVGGVVYFATDDGFFRTNGVNVEPIGHGKVDKHFTSTVDFLYPERVWGGVDWKNKVIYWSYPTSGVSGVANRVLFYNWLENRWGRAETTAHCLLYGNIVDSYSWGVEGFNSVYRMGSYESSRTNAISTPLTAILTTGEVEFTKGGYTRLQGVKALVRGTDTYTVAVGARNSQASAVTYTSEVTANSRSGFSDFRSEARYHRARVTISATFNSAQGVEYQIAPSGPV